MNAPEEDLFRHVEHGGEAAANEGDDHADRVVSCHVRVTGEADSGVGNQHRADDEDKEADALWEIEVPTEVFEEARAEGGQEEDVEVPQHLLDADEHEEDADVEQRRRDEVAQRRDREQEDVRAELEPSLPGLQFRLDPLPPLDEILRDPNEYRQKLSDEHEHRLHVRMAHLLGRPPRSDRNQQTALSTEHHLHRSA